MTIKIRMSEALEEYIRFGQARGLKPGSVRSQKETIAPLVQATGDKLVANVSALDVERYITSRNWKASTRNVRVGQLKSFFRWAEARGYRDATNNPMFGWRSVRVPEVARLRIPTSEWGQLFEACQHPTEQATIALGLFLFLRSSEAALVTWGDVNFEENRVTIWRQKTQQADELPMCAELAEMLRDYLAWYTDHLMQRGVAVQDSHFLLAPRDVQSVRFQPGGGHLRPSKQPSAIKVGVTVKRVLQRAGYEKADKEGFGGHVLRRSGARALFDQKVLEGYDGALKMVQAMLGHTHSVMTENYLGLALDKQRRNQAIAGKPMFPSLAAKEHGNVTPIRRQA